MHESMHHLAFSYPHKGESRRRLWVACGGTMGGWRGGPVAGRVERERERRVRKSRERKLGFCLE